MSLISAFIEVFSRDSRYLRNNYVTIYARMSISIEYISIDIGSASSITIDSRISGSLRLVARILS